MGWYEIAKVVHFLGFIALFGFFVIYSRAGPALRKATDLGQVRVWLGLLEAARPMMPAAAIMMFASGFAMAGLRWRGPYPFLTVGIVTLLVIWITVAVVGGGHRRAIRAAAGTQTEGPVSAELSRVIFDSRPWATLFALNTAALGVMFVMTTKIGWVPAISVVIGLSLFGALVGARLVAADRGRAATESRHE
jgi:hypothetical protein